MNRAPGLPGMRHGAQTVTANPWRAQQYFAAQDFETTLPASITWDLDAQQVRFITLAANTTIAFPFNLQRGATYILFLKQDATGSRTMTWSNQAGSQNNGTWKWTAATAPTLTTTAGKVDIITFACDGVHMYGTAIQNL